MNAFAGAALHKEHRKTAWLCCICKQPLNLLFEHSAGLLNRGIVAARMRVREP